MFEIPFGISAASNVLERWITIERAEKNKCSPCMPMLKMGMEAKLFGNCNGSRPTRQFYRNTPTLQSRSRRRKRRRRKREMRQRREKNPQHQNTCVILISPSRGRGSNLMPQLDEFFRILFVSFFQSKLRSEHREFFSCKRFCQDVSYHFGCWDLLDRDQPICHNFSGVMILDVDVL